MHVGANKIWLVENIIEAATEQCRKTPIDITRSRRTGPYRSREGFHIAEKRP